MNDIRLSDVDRFFAPRRVEWPGLYVPAPREPYVEWDSVRLVPKRRAREYLRQKRERLWGEP